jgi:protein Xni
MMNVLLIDGLNLIRRVCAAVRHGEEVSLDGVATDACLASVRKLIHRQMPSHVMCVMESSGHSWRHDLYPQYKANRKTMEPALQLLIKNIVELFEKNYIKSVQLDGYEADDVIASIATRVATAGGKVTIASTDKSFCQLIADNVTLYDHFSSKVLDREYVRERFGVTPEQLPDLFGLAGETGLNVPGVRSVGIRTAAKLITEFGTLESILIEAEKMKGHIGVKLRAGLEDARLAQELLTLRSDLDLGLNIKDYRYCLDDHW